MKRIHYILLLLLLPFAVKAQTPSYRPLDSALIVNIGGQIRLYKTQQYYQSLFTTIYNKNQIDGLFAGTNLQSVLARGNTSTINTSIGDGLNNRGYGLTNGSLFQGNTNQTFLSFNSAGGNNYIDNVSGAYIQRRVGGTTVNQLFADGRISGSDGTGNTDYTTLQQVNAKVAAIPTPTLQSVTNTDSVTTRSISVGSIKSGSGFNTDDYAKKLIVIGNSIAVGFYANPKSSYSWANLSSIALHADLVNYGIAGTNLVQVLSTDSSAISRINRIIPTYTSSMVALVSEYGTNDFNNSGTPYNETNFRNAYYQLIDAAIAKGWPLNKIILFLPYNSGTNKPAIGADALLTNIASVKGVVYAPVYSVMLAKGGFALVDPDATHPNNRGHAVIDSVLRLSIPSTSYKYSAVNQDLVVSSKITVGKGLYGGSDADGLELHSINTNGISRITAFENFYFKQNLSFNGTGGSSATASTAPNYIDLGQQYVVGAISTNAGLKLRLYANTGFGVSTTDGLVFRTGAGSTSRFTFTNDVYNTGNVILTPPASGALTTPPFFNSGVGAFTSAVGSGTNTSFRGFGGSGIAFSGVDGLAVVVAGGLVNRITLKAPVFSEGAVSTTDNLTIGTAKIGSQTTPAFFNSGSTAFTPDALSGVNTEYRGFGGSGMGFSSVDGLGFISAGGLINRITFKNPTYTEGVINSTGNIILGTGLSGSQSTPSSINLGSSFSATPAVGFKINMGNGYGETVSTNSYDRVAATAGAHNFYTGTTKTFGVTKEGALEVIGLVPSTIQTDSLVVHDPISKRLKLIPYTYYSPSDTTASPFRTKTNSYTLAQEQTKFNLYALRGVSNSWTADQTFPNLNVIGQITGAGLALSGQATGLAGTSSNNFVIKSQLDAVDQKFPVLIEVAGTSTALAGNATYIFHAATLTTASLPTTNPPIGTLITMIGDGSGQFRISQNAGQFIVSGNTSTTVGTGGYIQTSTNNTTITIRYVNTNKWQVTSSNSTPTIN